jgi:hypothetical protein
MIELLFAFIAAVFITPVINAMKNRGAGIRRCGQRRVSIKRESYVAAVKRN